MITDNIAVIRERIVLACARAKRDPKEIVTVAITKGRPTGEIREVVACGITNIGENRIQETVSKYRELSTVNRELIWHMVGHLQSNKVKDAVKIFDLIHSVDSLRLAEEINRQACKINKIQDILIEVKTSPEETKSGIKPEEAAGLIKDVSLLKNINVLGLMTIAPVVSEPEEARPYFRILRELLDKVNRLSTVNRQLSTLSMGMTDDFEIAIEEGANIIRLGRAFFEG